MEVLFSSPYVAILFIRLFPSLSYFLMLDIFFSILSTSVATKITRIYRFLSLNWQTYAKNWYSWTFCKSVKNLDIVLKRIKISVIPLRSPIFKTSPKRKKRKGKMVKVIFPFQKIVDLSSKGVFFKPTSLQLIPIDAFPTPSLIHSHNLSRFKFTPKFISNFKNSKS